MGRKTITFCDFCKTDFIPGEKPEMHAENTILSLLTRIDGKNVEHINKPPLEFCSPECLRLYAAQLLGIPACPIPLEDLRRDLLTVFRDCDHSYVREILIKLGVPETDLKVEEVDP